ncbi:hypothetical protein SAMN02799624_02311 [Paenibacillus sp. UNC496MF]|uniref:hypothetical protein n=1 Tax=Paenibacillus sp. UNC496MF TaxID=1502753 RepID=UPI0008E81E09|nr:hypothetical protein [Paenibacillus sp. UNC496MF]SFI81264.1 hypothetical protein SAMN02799624_02311 [Paenibacillus sp. UNC496MF]
MTLELPVAHCPVCGDVYRKNLRGLCADCSSAEDGQVDAIERALKRDRRLTNEQAAELAAVPAARIRTLIRRGRLKLYAYPNLADACDLCGAPIREGKLCGGCLKNLRVQIAEDREKQLKQKREHIYLTKRI